MREGKATCWASMSPESTASSTLGMVPLAGKRSAISSGWSIFAPAIASVMACSA